MTVNMLGSHHESRPSRTVAEWLWPFLPMGIAAFSLSALVYYHLRQNVFEVRSPLQQLYAGLYRTVGFAPAVMFFGLVILWSTIWLAVGKLDRPVARLLRLMAMAVMLGVFLNLGDGGVSPALHKGAIGAWFAETLVGAIGYWPSLLLVWAITFASLLLATDFFFHESFERLRGPVGPKEVGVEAAVTDHLRGLAEAGGGAQRVAAPVAERTLASDPGSSAPASLDRPAVGASLADLAVPAANEAVAEDETPRRRSYLERRAERQARSWRRPAEDEWVPAAPESQEIDNPESRAAGLPAMAQDQPEDAPSIGGSFAEVAPRAEGPGSDEDLPPWPTADRAAEADAASAEESPPERSEPSAASGELVFREVDELPSELLEASRHEAIVFPDEAPVVEAPVHEARPAPWPEADTAAPAAAAEGGELGFVDEPIVAIPRPEPAAASDEDLRVEPSAPVDDEPAARQRQLFGGALDEALVQEAIDVVTSSRRASATFLQRKLRIDYEQATEVLAELAARGVVALEGDASQGRVLG